MHHPTLLRMISGARYSGVPHNVQVRPLTRLAKPKSVTWKPEGRRERAGAAAAFRIHGAAPHLDVSVMVDEKILRLQISVYEI